MNMLMEESKKLLKLRYHHNHEAGIPKLDLMGLII
jgi:hypothetical protein